MTSPITTRAGRRIAALATAGVAAATLGGVALAVPAHAQGPATPAASAPSTTYSAAASASWDYSAGGVHATVTVTRLGDTAYKVQISGTTQSAKPTSIPVSFSSGVMVPTGSYPMQSGHGTMNLTSSAAMFTFSRAYEASYSAPFTFEGEWTAVVTTAQTSTQTITVGGHPYVIGVHAPATSGQADGAGQRIMVTRSFEVDRAVLRSPRVAALYFGADNDGGLGYGELSRLYTSREFKRDFSEQYRFVTVRVGKDAAQGEVDAAVNHALPHGWAPITTHARQTPTAHTPIVVTTAWEVQTTKGARPLPGGLAWGKNHAVPELFAGSSEQEHLA